MLCFDWQSVFSLILVSDKEKIICVVAVVVIGIFFFFFFFSRSTDQTADSR